MTWTWPASCDARLAEMGHPPSAVKGADYFTLHMALMTLAFCLFGPLASLWYYVFEDTFGLGHDLVKWTHGLLQLGSLAASVLGFVQIYYSNGAWCSFQDHFQSLHSMIGVRRLARPPC